MAVSTTGTNYIDALQSGYSWTGNSGQAYTLGYSFTFNDYPSYAIPASYQAHYLNAMQQWSNVANISFTKVAYANSDLDFVIGDLQNNVIQNYPEGTIGVTAYDYSGSRLVYAMVAVDSQYSTAAQMAPGTGGFHTLLHEIGHAIGLEHPRNYAGESPPHLSAGEDTVQNTVMSYYDGALVRDTVNAPQGPMIYDIAAIQHLYGANTSYLSGDTYHNLGNTLRNYTIWDGGGNDWLMASGFNTPVSLDLREGINYYSVTAGHYIWNAFNANIENAYAGSNNDSLNGNALANLLAGGAGNDVLFGWDGNDSLVGDATSEIVSSGNDAIYGGEGNDTIYPGPGIDTIYGGNGSDYIDDGWGSDTVYGQQGGDFIYLSGASHLVYADDTVEAGTDGSDRVWVYGGDDRVFGGGGDDIVYLGAGNDTLDGGSGNEIIFGQEGNDSLIGGTGNDILAGDQLSVAAGDGNDYVRGDLGNDTLYGGGGDDLIYGDGTIAGGSDGNDRILGFEGMDTIHAGGGSDTVYGGEQQDTIYGGADGDSIFGDGWNDWLYGDTGNDTIAGGDGNDYLYGEANGPATVLDNDILDGGAGNDTIIGSGGNNTLTGGIGNDVFYYAAGRPATDTISDFEGAGAVGGDIIRVFTNGSYTAADLAAAVTYGGGNASLTMNLFGDTISITIVGVASGMTASDFEVL